MDTKLDLDNLDSKIKIADYITLFALVFTLLGTTLSLYYRDKQNKLLKNQREKDQVNIAKSGELSETAKKDAALAFENAAKSNERANNAELKSKQLEFDLMKLKLAVSDRFIPTNMASVLSSELKKTPQRKVVIQCVISNTDEPIAFSKKLNELFISSNWESVIINQSNTILPSPTGINIIAVGESNKQIAALFFKHFSELGYKCKLSFHEKGQTDLIIQVRAH